MPTIILFINTSENKNEFRPTIWTSYVENYYQKSALRFFSRKIFLFEESCRASNKYYYGRLWWCLPVTLVWEVRSFARVVWDPWHRDCGCDESTISWYAAGGVWTKSACVWSAGDRTRDRRYRPRRQTIRPGRTPFPCCTNRSSSCLKRKNRKLYIDTRLF